MGRNDELKNLIQEALKGHDISQELEAYEDNHPVIYEGNDGHTSALSDYVRRELEEEKRGYWPHDKRNLAVPIPREEQHRKALKAALGGMDIQPDYLRRNNHSSSSDSSSK